MLVGFLLLLGGLFMMYWGYTQLNGGGSTNAVTTSVNPGGTTVQGNNA